MMAIFDQEESVDYDNDRIDIIDKDSRFQESQVATLLLQAVEKSI